MVICILFSLNGCNLTIIASYKTRVDTRSEHGSKSDVALRRRAITVKSRLSPGALLYIHKIENMYLFSLNGCRYIKVKTKGTPLSGAQCLKVLKILSLATINNVIGSAVN